MVGGKLHFFILACAVGQFLRFFRQELFQEDERERMQQEQKNPQSKVRVWPLIALLKIARAVEPHQVHSCSEAEDVLKQIYTTDEVDGLTDGLVAKIWSASAGAHQLERLQP